MIVTTILYFGHMLVISGIITMISGTIGLIASFIFMLKVYTSIKID